METKEVVESKTLRKRAALEYLEAHGKATAKALAIDLDSSAATASELLERCTSQNLVERDEGQRPREYRLTVPGRERLEFFRSQDAPLVLPAKTSNPSSRNSPANNPGSTPEDQPEHKSMVDVQYQSLREDLQDLFEALGLRRPRGEESAGVPSQIEKLKERAARLSEKSEGALAEKSKEALASEAIVKLYRAGHALASPDAQCGFVEGLPTEQEVADLERQAGKEAAEKIERLVELEDGQIGPRYREKLQLRSELALPADVVGVEEMR